MSDPQQYDTFVTDGPRSPHQRPDIVVNDEVFSSHSSYTSSHQGINNEGVFTLDSFLEQLGFGLFHIARFFCVGFIAFMDGAVIMTLSLSLVVLKNEWGFSSTVQGAAASIVFFAVVIGAYLSGPIADKYGRRFPLLISCFVICVVNLASAFSTNIITYTVFKKRFGIMSRFLFSNRVRLHTGNHASKQTW